MAYSTRKLSLVSEQDIAADDAPSLSDASRPLGTVSATLRAARLAHGSTLPEIADALRIRLGYLEAIEDARFSELPGTVYAIGFIRTYADHLGLDAPHLISKFKEEVEQPEAEQELHFLAAEPETRIPGGSLMLVGLLLGAVIYGVWFYVSSTERTLVDLIPDFPDRFNALILQQPAPIAGDGEIAAPAGPDGGLPGDGAGETAALDLPLGRDVPGSPPEEPPVAESNAPLILPAPLGQAEAPQPAVPGTEPTGPMLLPVTPQEQAALPAQPAPAAPQAAPQVPPGTAEAPAALPLPSDDTGAAQPLAGIGVAESQPLIAPAAPAAPSAAPAASAVPAAPAAVADNTAPALEPQDLEAPAQPVGQSSAIAAARPPGPPESATFGGENADSRVLINAIAMSWVQVRDDAGNLVMTRVLQPGESYRVPNRPGLQMVTGNAGGIEIFVDGQPTPSFGRPGDVVRNIDLSPEALLNGTAVPQ